MTIFDKKDLLASMSRRNMLKGTVYGTTLAAASTIGFGTKAYAAQVDKDLEYRRKVLAQAEKDASGYNTRLVMLGTAGGPMWWPNDHRHGPAAAVVVGDAVYLMDCGEGVGHQYVESVHRPNGIPGGRKGMENLRAIFISHIHSDHLVDYHNIMSFAGFGTFTKENPVHVYGPASRGTREPVKHEGIDPKDMPKTKTFFPERPEPNMVEFTEALYEASAADINDRMQDYFYPDPHDVIKVHNLELPKIEGFISADKTPSPDMKPFKVYEDDRVRVSATLVYHYPIFPAYAFRFDTDDGSIVFSGDTGPSENLIRLAKGADILVHEVLDRSWVESVFVEPMSVSDKALEEHMYKSHTFADEVGKIAEKAGVKKLVLNHIVPGNTPIANLKKAQNNFSGQMIIGEDLMPIGVGKRR